jgi:hypothetical protein
MGDFGDAGVQACGAIPGFVARDWRLSPTLSWSCAYAPAANPPDDSSSKSLQAARSSDTNATGSFSTTFIQPGEWEAFCVSPSPGGAVRRWAANPLG